MNRAERRRQRILAAKATKKPKPEKSVSPSSKQQTLTLQQAMDLAVEHHEAGRLQQAERIYQQILQANPKQPVALHLLGVIAHQVGENDIAVDWFTKALAVRPGYAEAHYNLGNALRGLGELDAAAKSFRQALSIKPNYSEAHYNLGNTSTQLGRLTEACASYRAALVGKPNYAEAHNNLGYALKELGRPDEAIDSYRNALAARPDYAEAHNNLGYVFNEMERLDDATACYRKALAIKPDYAVAHNNLGTALQELGKLDEAIACYRKALAIKPDYAGAYNNLGLVLQDIGEAAEALACLRRAISLNPDNELFWAGYEALLESFSFTSVDDNIWQELLQLLERPGGRPSNITRPIISALHHQPQFAKVLEAAGRTESSPGICYQEVSEQLSSIPLFLRIIELSPIDDLEIERVLTRLRRALLGEATTEKATEKGLPFSAALALQCFVNEYVFVESDEEFAAVEKIQQRIAKLLNEGRDVPPHIVATLGAYRPLHGFPWARELRERAWSGEIKEVIKRQMLEPLEEGALRDQIPHLTKLQDTVSKAVREQYEENPYPRWIKTGLGIKGMAVGDVLQGPPLGLDLGDYTSPESPEILVAGCGTGQHVVVTASRFSNARVLALDLSLNSLSYALRKTRELDFSNIDYAQADIMELGALERRFDLIECVGVLHHLGEPWAGLEILVELLRPGGLMLIGLYSEAARQDIVRGRALIAEKGYTTAPRDIRRCRQYIIDKAENGDGEMAKICNSRDFYSLSSCRDLLFHTQERNFTLPQIEAALKAHGLRFLGFETPGKFKTFHPNTCADTSLTSWHKFELKYPDTFRSMYQFWCRKM